MTPKKAKVFISYAHEDRKYLTELKAHLSPLERSGDIIFWCDQEIVPGDKWADEIRERLQDADMVLLLVSSDFLNSDYCSEIEFKAAQTRAKNSQTRIIPIIVRDCAWQSSPLAGYDALPDDAKPVRSWRDHDEAFVSVVCGIGRALSGASLKPSGKRTRTPVKSTTSGAKSARDQRPLSPKEYRNTCGNIVLKILLTQPNVEGLDVQPDAREFEDEGAYEKYLDYVGGKNREAAIDLNVPDEEGIVASFGSTCWWKYFWSNYYLVFGDSALFLENSRREKIRIAYSDFPNRNFSKTADGQLGLGSGDVAFLKDKVFNADYLLTVLLLLKKAFTDAGIASRKPERL
jgi:hypothetical protein